MISTSRITSDFDIELQLGSWWFYTALNLMNDNGLLAPPGIPVIIESVKITFEPDWDLEIKVLGFAIPVYAKAELSPDGSELIFNTSFPQIGEKRIPFGALKGLSQPPVLRKLPGDEEHEDVMCILANLDIHAETQKEDRLPAGEFVARGNPDDAQSFLPLGKDIAFGMNKSAFKRFANNIWHTNLRASDGSHPLPDEDNKKGEWSKVSMKPEKDKIRIILEGDIPVDSPIIDLVPDPHVTITLILTPSLKDGKLSFSIETETDIDTGLLGDLFGGLAGAAAGAIIGLVIGLITGGILAGVLIGAGIGLVVGVIVIEIGEAIAEGYVQNEMKAKINGKEIPEAHCCDAGIVNRAKVQTEGFNLSVLDSIPTSIPIYTENPEDEFLYKRSLLVTSLYDEIKLNGTGFAVAGMSGVAELFLPEVVSIVSSEYAGDELISLKYRRSNGSTQDLPVQEVFQRTGEAELKAPFKLAEQPEDSDLRIPGGKLACVCLKPKKIHRVDTVVEEIMFENGLKLKVKDAVALQDAAAIVIKGYQLIHPKDSDPYFRAKADDSEDNNFESLEEY
jgi:hypothetical protein